MVFRLVNAIFTILEFAILANVLVSWLPVPRDNQFIRMLYAVTEPILAPIRGFIQKSSFGRNMMFDFSPIVALILIYILKNIILSIL